MQNLWAFNKKINYPKGVKQDQQHVLTGPTKRQGNTKEGTFEEDLAQDTNRHKENK